VVQERNRRVEWGWGGSWGDGIGGRRRKMRHLKKRGGTFKEQEGPEKTIDKTLDTAACMHHL